MRIDLKSGEYLDFLKIKRVEIFENNMITFIGNFEKGGRNKTYQVFLRAIKNIKELNRFLKKEMKFYQVDGTCPHCGNLNNIEEVGLAHYTKRLNKPKEKAKFEVDSFTSYKCNACKKRFQDLKYVNLVIYTK